MVFYKDWWEAMQSLPEGKRLEAIAAVMDYAFSGIEPEDTMLRFATAQIRMFIDRDRERYEKSVQQRREAIRKRWEKAKANGGKESDMNEYDRMQSNSEEYNNENGNGNDNGNDNVNVNVNERQSNINIPPSQTTDNKNNSAHAGRSAGQGLDGQIAQCKASQMWKEGIQRKYSLHDTGEVDRLLDEFATDMVCQEAEVRNAKRFFMSWLNERRREQSDPDRQQDTRLGPGEFRDEHGHRRFSVSNETVVPENAPPRPSNGHYWNPISGYWENAI